MIFALWLLHITIFPRCRIPLFLISSCSFPYFPLILSYFNLLKLLHKCACFLTAHYTLLLCLWVPDFFRLITLHHRTSFRAPSAITYTHTRTRAVNPLLNHKLNFAPRFRNDTRSGAAAIEFPQRPVRTLRCQRDGCRMRVWGYADKGLLLAAKAEWQTETRLLVS